MGSPILGSSNFPIIGANRCLRKWVNKIGPKILPMKFLMLHLTENWALTLIQKNSLPSTAHGSQSSDKQKFHSAPKQRRPVSTEVLSNWPFILWLQRTASSAWWFTFLSRELSTYWYEIMHLPILGDFPQNLSTECHGNPNLTFYCQPCIYAMAYQASYSHVKTSNQNAYCLPCLTHLSLRSWQR